MFKELEELAALLGLSQGQILELARVIVGDNIRTIDLLTREERMVLISELKQTCGLAAV